ncbi:MAG: sialidase family protein [Chloroflexota bacterium]
MSRRIAPFGALLSVVVAVTPVLAATYSTSGLIDTSGVSPLAGCTADDVAGQEAAFGDTNFPNAEVEPWIDVNPTNPANLIGGYQQDRWMFGGSRSDVASVTLDSGATWQQVVIPGVTKCAGGPFDRATDPVLSFGPDGTAWFVSQAFDVFDSRTGLLVSKSTDGGLTWGDPVDVSPVNSDPPRFPFDDKVSITADPGDADNVYVAWDRGLIPFSWTRGHNDHFRYWGSKQPTLFTRTTDGGTTWETPRVLYNPGANNFTIFSQIVVLPDGTLVDMIFEFLARKNNDGGGPFTPRITILRSSDKGVHWSKPIRAAELVGASLLDTQLAQRVGGQMIAVDRNPSSLGYGNLYAVWTDGRFSDGMFGDIAFAMSRDGGQTWSAPSRANLTPAGHSAFTPTVAVAADGTVGVGYYDERNYGGDAGGGPLTTDVWLSHCHLSTDCTTNGSWSETHVAGPFDQKQAADAGGLFLGDYAGLVASGNAFYPYYAIAGDRNVDPSDIYFARVGP